jgi:hypothetical protein
VTVRVYPNIVYNSFNFSLEVLDIQDQFYLGDTHVAPSMRIVDSRTSAASKCTAVAYEKPFGLLTNASNASVPIFCSWDEAKRCGYCGCEALSLVNDLKSSRETILNTNAGLPNSTFQIKMMHGGPYKICYSAQGRYDASDFTFPTILPMQIEVPGVASPCVTHGCMQNLPWDCWYGFADGYAECVFHPFGIGGRAQWEVFPGDVSRVWWSAKYVPDQVDSDGVYISHDFVECGTTPDSSSMMWPGLIDMHTPNQGVDLLESKIFRSVMPGITKDADAGFTVTLCYCPDYDKDRMSGGGAACDEPFEYIQPVGLLYMWYLRICDVGDLDDCGSVSTTRYARVLPQQPFGVRLDCPAGGACKALSGIPGQLDAQLRFIESEPENDLPRWSPDHGCIESDVSKNAIWTSVNIGGGPRSDYKAWGPVDNMGSAITFSPLLRMSMRKKIDVCYCDFDCSTNLTYFKVGEVRVTTEFALAALSNESSSPRAVKTIDRINFPASFTLFSGIDHVGEYDENTGMRKVSPWNQPHFASQRAKLFFVSYDREKKYGMNGDETLEKAQYYDRVHPDTYEEVMDSVCREASPGQGLFHGVDTVADYTKYDAFLSCPGTGNCIKSKRLAFDGYDHSERLRPLRAGTVAACYCAELDPMTGDCKEAPYIGPVWFYVARLTIRGPIGGQTWVFPTLTDVHLPILGWGLSGDDTLRLIPMEHTCADLDDEDGKNPDSIASDVIKVDCPAMYGQGCTFSDETTSIKLHVEDFESTEAFVSSVRIENSYFELHFSKDVRDTLADDDVITLDLSMMQVDGVSQNLWTPEQESVAYKIAGTTIFQDSSSRTSYITGTKIAFATSSDGGVHPTKVTAPGRFEAPFPTVTLTESKGRWTRRNRAETSAEIKAVSPVNVRVCWGTPQTDADGNAGDMMYYAEAGLASFHEPKSMPFAQFAITNTAVRQPTQVLIAFVPGGQDPNSTTPGPDYANLEGQLELRFAFVDLVKLEPRITGDIEPVDVVDDNGDPIAPEVLPDKDRIHREKGTQGTCGKLFAELWSNDDDGFPVPERCYFSEKRRDSGYYSVSQYFREYFMTFPLKAGIKSKCVVDGVPDQPCKYMVVMNAVASEFEKGENLVDIYTQCVGCPVAYTILEKGVATSMSAATDAPGAENPQMQKVQLQKLDDLHQKDLLEQNIIQMEFTSYDYMKKMRGGSVVRIYLYPIALWAVQPGTCNAVLIGMNPNDPSAKLSCTAESLLPSFADRNSVLSIPLPEGYEITSTNRPLLQVAGINLPDEGWFPQRILVSVEDDEGRPHFSTTHGFLFKSGASSMIAAPRLISDGPIGAGVFPFRSPAVDDRPDKNYAVLRLQFGATMRQERKSDGRTVDTRLTIQLPDGYVCEVEKNNAVPDASTGLFQLDENADGFPDYARSYISKDSSSGRWKFRNDRFCVYDFNDFQTLYAKSVVYIKMKLWNPASVLSKIDPENKWLVTMQSQGYHMDLTEGHVEDFGRELHLISLEEERALGRQFWQANVPVLARMDNVLLQATNTMIGTVQQLLVWFHPSGDATAKEEPIDWYVVLDAPRGFDFENPCRVRTLHEDYYSFTNLGVDMTTEFLGLRECVGSKKLFSTYGEGGEEVAPDDEGNNTIHTRARFGVKGKLFRDKLYGFRIDVRNPVDYMMDMGFGWMLFLEDTSGYALDGLFGDIAVPEQPRSEHLFSCRRRGPPAAPDDEYFNYLQVKYGGLVCRKATLTCEQPWMDCREMDNMYWDYAFGTYERDGMIVPAVTNGDEDPFFYPTLSMDSMLPFSMSRSAATVTICPFVVYRDMETNMRISAPLGYEWSDLSETTNFKAGGFQALYFSFDSFIAEEYGVSERHSNQILIGRVVLYASKVYGFRASVRLPDRIPTSTANRFIVEIGYRERILKNRHMSFSLAAYDVKAIRNARVQYLSNLAGYASNLINIEFQMVTDLYENDGLMITADLENKCLDENDRQIEGCEAMYFKFDPTTITKPKTGHCMPFERVGDSDPFPSDLECWAMYNDGVPQIRLLPQRQKLSAGHYKFQVEAQNPTTAFERRTLWDFAAVTDIARNMDLIDLNLTTQSSGNLPPMHYAGFYDLPMQQRAATGRDDRPFRYNSIIITFAFSAQPYFMNDFIVRAPEGFYFDEDCLAGVVTDADEIMGFDESTGQWNLWPDPMQTEYNKWPELAHVDECLGGSSVARIRFRVTLDFVAEYKFMMRIQVRNPVKTPVVNMWTLEYNKEASKPFDGFTIWAFKGATCRPSSVTATSTHSGNPVRFEFTPTQTIPPAFSPGYFDEGFGQYRRLQDGEERAVGGKLRLEIPEGFVIVPRPPNIYTGLIGCPLILTELDTEFIFREEDYICVHNSSRVVIIEFSTDKTLVEDTMYSISLRVQNPSSIVSALPWHMQSYDQSGSEMDEAYVEGFMTVQPALLWDVKNLNNEAKGKHKLTAQFILQLNDPLQAGDDLIMIAPLGFAIRSPGTDDTCKDFLYLDTTEAPFPTDLADQTRSGYPECFCEYRIMRDGSPRLSCYMKLKVRKKRSDLSDRQVFLPAKQMIGWTIATRNPPQQADEIDWAWVITHQFSDQFDGVTKRSESTVECWTSQAQLDKPIVNLLGPFFRSSSVSTLLVGFTPVHDATTLVVIAVSPAGFDFTKAIVERPLELPDEIFENRKFVVNNCGIKRKVHWNVTVSNVKLGRMGGQTSITIQTFADGRLKEKRDEVQEFRKGFRLPGELITVSKVLNSFYAEESYKYPLAAMYPARRNQMSRARMVILTTQPVMSQERIFIECKGADPYSILDMTVKVAQEAETVQVNSRRLATSLMQVVVNPTGGRKEVALQAQLETELFFWVLPTAGENLWLFYTTDMKALPTNTNDMLEIGFDPVQEAEVEVYIEKSPPESTVEVQLRFLSIPLGDIREVEVVAPIGFTFPVACGDMCFPGPRKLPGTSQMRPSAILRRNGGIDITDRLKEPFNLLVETPQFNLSNVQWAVAVKGPADKSVGWGLASGFGIRQMPYASVRYGGVLALKEVLIAVTFFVRPINAGMVTRVIVLAPMDPPFEMRCSTADAIRRLSLGNGRVVPDLPGATSCTDESPLTLSTDLPLPEGPHAFMVMANIPDVPPVTNFFDILLLDETGATVDAAYKVSGVKYQKLPVKNPIFTWWGPGDNGQAKAKHHAEVTMGIELTEAYSPQSNFTIRAILVTFPTNFSQDIPRAHEVENLNENFSAASGEFWVDLKVNTQLKIVLNEYNPWLSAGVYNGDFRSWFRRSMDSRIGARTCGRSPFAKPFCASPRTTSTRL